MKEKKEYPLIASHRGGSLVWGENSRRAFEETLNLDVDLVEFDVHPSKDGILVVHHDATLDRTTDMSGPVCEKTWQELSQGTVNFSGGQRIMTLEELCLLYQDSNIKLRLEIKSDVNRKPYANIVTDVLSVLEKAKMIEKTIISSFNCEILKDLSHEAPEIFRIWLVAKGMTGLLGDEYLIQLARSMQINEISVQVNELNEQTRQRVIEAGFYYGCYGAHTALLINKALQHNVYAFTSDRPDLAIKLRHDFIQGDIS